MRHAAGLAAFLVAVAVFAAGIWWLAYSAAIGQLAERGRADLALAADRLTGQLQRFGELAVLMSDHPTLVPLVSGAGDPAAAEVLLLAMADKTSAQTLVLAGADGGILAASGATARADHSGQPYFDRAMTGALGAYHAVDPGTGRRIFTYAAPVFGPDGPAAGAVIVTVDIGGIEQNWPADPDAVFFTDELGVVFVTNRSDLTLTVRDPQAPRRARSADYAGVALAPFPGFSAGAVGAHEIWSLDGGRYLPGRALHLVQQVPVIGLTGEILLDTTPARNVAWLQSAVAAAVCLAFGALLFLAAERRRALSDRLEIEAAANAALEARVADRTAELSEANAELRREVRERKEAEAALKKAQADLVQAGKLSALGQMSAGISHELNQPLMAIQSFASNAEEFLAKGRPEIAAGNLGRIAQLAHRMGRIIRNLRAFARQEDAPMTDVDLAGVVDAALELAEPKLRGAGVAVDWARPAEPVWVRGGEVRLQQVATNLISNAVDAMEASPEKHLVIAIDRGPGPVCLTVRDTGPGLDDPEKIFDPFYTTKTVGQGDGMGLGLSISYGLVQSFGGAIRGRNAPGGGAVFTVELDPARAGERAA